MLRYTDMLSVDAPLLLGVRLRPLSLGAIIHLQANECIFLSPVDVPLFQPDKKETIARLTYLTNELVVALTICSLTYQEFIDLCNNRLWLEDEQKLIGVKQYMARWNVALKQMIAKGDVNILQTIFLFNQYLEKGYEKPEVEYTNVKPDHSEPTVDWITTLTETLTQEKNVTLNEVLDQPLKLTFLQFYKLGEKNGVIHFMTDTEKQLRDMAVKGVTQNG